MSKHERTSIQDQANVIREAIKESLQNDTPYMIQVTQALLNQVFSLPRQISDLMKQEGRALFTVPLRRTPDAYWIMLGSKQETQVLLQDKGIASLLTEQYQKLMMATRNNNTPAAHEIWSTLNNVLLLDPRVIDNEITTQNKATIDLIELPPSLFDMQYSGAAGAQQKLNYMRTCIYTMWINARPSCPKDDEAVAAMVLDPDTGASLFLMNFWDIIGSIAPGIQNNLRQDGYQPVDKSRTI